MVLFSKSLAGKSVWNLFFQFPDLEKVWKFVKSFGNFNKGLEFFAFYLKNFDDRKCASIPLERSEAAVASLTESSSGVIPSFVPIYRTNCAWQARSCLPAA